MQYKSFVLLALAASIDLGVTQPIKREPGSTLSKPAVMHANACASGFMWTASGCIAIAAQFAPPAAAGHLTTAANAANAVAGGAAFAAAAGAAHGHYNPQQRPNHV